MAKEWILNSAMNRFQLNFKRNVGAVSEAIRKCEPKSKEDWEKYYFDNVKSRSHIEELGKKLFVKITEVIQYEISDISEQDCVDYLFNMVIDRTYDGYTTEITTIYGQLQNHFELDILPAEDKWDRIYNVDFYIKVNEKYIGLQIKPIGNNFQLQEIFKEHKIQIESHKKFTKKYGGKVFYIFSKKESGKKVIANPEVINDIKSEIMFLSSV